MNFNDSPEEAKFRAEVRRWIRENGAHFIPAHDVKPGTPEYFELARRWQRAKAEAGYAGFYVEPKYGGRGGPLIEAAIFSEEESHHPLYDSTKYFVMGQGQIATALGRHAPHLLEKFGRPSITGDIIWCQLWSEPAAGSDMAGIRSTAVRDGDEWIVNGQKCWNSYAPPANWGILTARTDPGAPKHKGMSVFIVKLDTPGLELRPIKQITGKSEFNEAFFTDLRIPDSQRVGGVGDGWKVALTLMQTTRLAIMGDPATMLDRYEQMMSLALKPTQSGKTLYDDKVFRGRMADYFVTRKAKQVFGHRMMTTLSRGGVPGAEAILGKLVLGNLAQTMTAIGLDAIGPLSMVANSDDQVLNDLQYAFLRSPASRTGDGTDEISRNIIGERVLGLPPEPRIDKDLPFNQLP